MSTLRLCGSCGLVCLLHGRSVGDDALDRHGRVLKKVSSDILIDELFHEIDKWIAEGMKRPKRLKMAKPAALAMAEASLIPLE